MKSAIILVLFLVMLPVNSSQGAFEVNSSLGASFCGDKTLRKGLQVSPKCQLETQARSNVYLKNKEAVLAFGENTSAVIENDSFLKMSSGIARLKIKGELVLITAKAKLTLKNGDFLVRVSKFFNETEVVNFSGVSILETSQRENEYARVSRGQWGGVGGRFSDKIGDLINLTERQVEVFKTLLK